MGKTRKFKKYSDEVMAKAVDEIKLGASVLAVSVYYGISRTTLRRYICHESLGVPR